MQRRNFLLEPGDALHEPTFALPTAFRFLPERGIRRPAHADLVGFAPVSLCAIVLVFAGQIELERIRHGDAFRHLQPRAALGDVAHDAVEARQPVVEIDPAFDEGLMSDQRATLDHELSTGRHAFLHAALMRYANERAVDEYQRRHTFSVCGLQRVEGSQRVTLGAWITRPLFGKAPIRPRAETYQTAQSHFGRRWLSRASFQAQDVSDDVVRIAGLNDEVWHRTVRRA